MLDVLTELGYLEESFDVNNVGKLNFLLLGYLLVSNNDIVIGSTKGIKLGYTDGKVLGTIHVYVYIINIGLMLEHIWAL